MRSLSRKAAGTLFLLPALAVLGGVLVFPLLFSLGLSFSKLNMLEGRPPQFVGLANYIQVLGDAGTWNSLWVTFIFVIATLACELAFGTLLALFIYSFPPRMRFVRTFLLIPMMVAEVVTALSWRFLLDPDFGIINHVVVSLGGSAQAWTNAQWALVSIIAVDIWHNTSFVTLILLAGLQSIPHEFLESAKVDGAAYVRRVRHIILPLVNPQLVIALLFRLIFSMRVFTTPWVLTGGGPADRTLVYGIDIYRTAFRYYEMGTAASLSWILVVVSMIITVLYLRLFSREGMR